MTKKCACECLRYFGTSEGSYFGRWYLVLFIYSRLRYRGRSYIYYFWGFSRPYWKVHFYEYLRFKRLVHVLLYNIFRRYFGIKIKQTNFVLDWISYFCHNVPKYCLKISSRKRWKGLMATSKQSFRWVFVDFIGNTLELYLITKYQSDCELAVMNQHASYLDHIIAFLAILFPDALETLQDFLIKLVITPLHSDAFSTILVSSE